MDTKKRQRNPTDGLGRRVRGHRTPSGKRIVIGARDLEILALLRRYRFLRSTQLWALLPKEVRGKSFKRFQDRLTDLFHETNTPHEAAYLDWPQQQRDAYSARYAPSIYALSPAGEDLLRDRGMPVTNVTDLVRDGRMEVDREFVHAMMICDALASIETGARADTRVRFIPWQEIMAKAPVKTKKADHPFTIPVTVTHRFAGTDNVQSEDFRLIPDGLFGLEYREPNGRKLYRFFALEAEHRNRVTSSSLKPTSFLKKVLAYRHIAESGIHKTHFGIPNLLLATVAPTQARIKTMVETVNDVAGPAFSPMFLFNTMPPIGHEKPGEKALSRLFETTWQRADYGAFALNRP